MEPTNSILVKLVKSVFGQIPDSLHKSGSGVNSIGYVFSVNKLKYFIRISAKKNGFVMDKIAASFKTGKLLIPDTIKIGKIDNYFYSITTLCPGKPLIEYDENFQVKYFNQFLDLSYRIHSTKIPNQSRSGPLLKSGIGKYKDWQSFVRREFKKSYPILSEYFGKNILKIIKLSKKIPSCNHLVHGDFGYNNVFATTSRITGIIDWSDIMYGDFVYDIAHASFWANYTDYEKLFLAHYKSKNNLNLDNYRDRLNIYTVLICAKLMNFFIKKSDTDGLEYIREKLENYLNLHGLK